MTEHEEPQAVRTWREWLIAAFLWDGLWPAVIISVPWVLIYVFGMKGPGGAALAAFVIPIIAAVVRAGVAEKQLERISQGKPRLWRRLTVVPAIVCLMLFEILVNAMQFDGNPELGFLYVAAMLWCAYFTLMAIALTAPRNLHGSPQAAVLEFGEIKIPIR